MVIHDKRKKFALAIINIIIELFYLPVRMFRKKVVFENFNPGKILLIRIDHIGDVVMTSPSFSLLKEKFPAAEVLLLTSSAGKELYRNHPDVDELLVFNWPWSYQKSDNKFTVQKIREIINLVLYLRKKKVDLCVDFRGDLRFVLLFGVFAGVRVRISNSRSGNSSLLHHITPYDHGKHEVERSMEVLSCLVTPQRRYYPHLTVSPAEVNAVKGLMGDMLGLSDFSKLALIAPYSSQHIKSWPDEYFQEVIRDLLPKGYTVLVMGTQEDVRDAQSLVAPFSADVFSIAGKTKIREAAALISIASVIIGVDTGVLHIASCFNIPIVAIFGATRSLEYAPYSENTIIADSGKCACNQFLHMSCDHPVNRYSRCLVQLTPDQVIKTIGKAILTESEISDFRTTS